MKSSQFLFWAFVVGMALLLYSGVGALPRSNAVQKKAEADVQGIPLQSIYSTNGQEGLRSVTDSFILQKDGTKKYAEPYGHFLAEIHQDLRSGASNVFLVRGKDITAAVQATWLASVGGRSAEVPVSPEDGSERTPSWLVVYFGIQGSEPPGWLIKSVERRGETVKLNYMKRLAETKDKHHYLAWVPVGELAPGPCTLELFDAEKMQVTLLRRVTVQNK